MRIVLPLDHSHYGKHYTDYAELPGVPPENSGNIKSYQPSPLVYASLEAFASQPHSFRRGISNGRTFTSPFLPNLKYRFFADTEPCSWNASGRASTTSGYRAYRLSTTTVSNTSIIDVR